METVNFSWLSTEFAESAGMAQIFTDDGCGRL